jgi:hypothetical protein
VPHRCGRQRRTLDPASASRAHVGPPIGLPHRASPPCGLTPQTRNRKRSRRHASGSSAVPSGTDFGRAHFHQVDQPETPQNALGRRVHRVPSRHLGRATRKPFAAILHSADEKKSRLSLRPRGVVRRRLRGRRGHRGHGVSSRGESRSGGCGPLRVLASRASLLAGANQRRLAPGRRPSQELSFRAVSRSR